ncbi:MAG: HlyC/CorC family transporter [Deltaproteobacteria bacterium]|nr:HlyC/CorC family transporter [Deltaproteobacteria bacterium]
MNPELHLIIAICLVFLNACFVAAEFAIVKVRATRIQERLQDGVRGAAATQNILSNLDAYLSATQLGITLASLGLGWVGEPAFANLIGPVLAAVGIWSPTVVHSISLTLAFAAITFLHIVLGELAPKYLAIQRPEAVALAVAVPLLAFRRMLYPALWLLNSSSNATLRVLGINRAANSELVHSEEELRLLLAESHRTGALSASKRKLLENVFDYTHRSAKHIMVPRAEIVYLTLRKSLAENLDVIRNNQHTRYPLCETDIDHVVGMIHTKDLLQPAEGVLDVRDLLRLKREILFVPETRSLELLQRDFQQRRVHMALVVDEYGGTSGLVTLEDILEEIVGEIQDEFDAEPPKMEAIGDGYVVDGLVLIDEIGERLKIEIPERESNTLGGFVIARLGRIARVGDIVWLDGYDVKVVEMKGRRVSKLLLTPAPEHERPPQSA